MIFMFLDPSTVMNFMFLDPWPVMNFMFPDPWHVMSFMFLETLNFMKFITLTHLGLTATSQGRFSGAFSHHGFSAQLRHMLIVLFRPANLFS